jgi:hypothetical protein
VTDFQMRRLGITQETRFQSALDDVAGTVYQILPSGAVSHALGAGATLTHCWRRCRLCWSPNPAGPCTLSMTKVRETT